MNYGPEKFSGIGTIMVSDMFNVQFDQTVCEEDMIKSLNHYLGRVTRIIRKHDGIVLQFAGDAVLAFWHPKHQNPNHAQLAFNAGMDILSQTSGQEKNFTYSVDVILGSGDMAGDFFGPNHQFQVIGKASSICTRISQRRCSGHSSVRMSQYTKDLISPADLQFSYKIPREGLEDLSVYTCQLAPVVQPSID